MRKLILLIALLIGFKANAQHTDFYASGNIGGALIIGYTVPYFTIGIGAETPINNDYFIDAQVNAPVVFLIQPSLGFGKYAGQNGKASLGLRTFPQAIAEGELAIGGYLQYEYNNWNVNLESFGPWWINATVGYRYYF